MKKHILVAVIFSLFTSLLFAQKTSTDVNVGDIFVIGEVYNDNYKHINFPKANLIIKKGGIATYKHIKGAEVVVTSVDKKKDGSVMATIKLTSKKSFFNSHKFITVAIDEAVRQKELIAK
ncbi:MAG: dihydroorotase [Kordia sp.]|uniref:dihydroorotase n=1 Tax=Kordia sp. TaxID=1965332 RepID=UPI00385F916D